MTLLQHGEERDNFGNTVFKDCAILRVGPHLKILTNSKIWKNQPSFWHLNHAAPNDLASFLLSQRFPVKTYVARSRWHET